VHRPGVGDESAHRGAGLGRQRHQRDRLHAGHQRRLHRGPDDLLGRGNVYKPAIGPTTGTGLRQSIYYAPIAVGGTNTVATFTLAAGPGFTSRVITNPDGDIAEDRIVTAATAYSATAPISTGNWVMQMATFK
jgi:hypothetical protein